MKKLFQLYLLFIVAGHLKVISQELNLRQGFSFTAGPQFLSDSHRSRDREVYELYYDKTAYSASIGYLQGLSPDMAISGTIRTSYRSGRGYEYWGALGGSTTTQGNFKLLRTDIMLNGNSLFFRRKRLLLSYGFYYGAIVSAQGEAERSGNGFSGSYETKLGVTEPLRKNQFGTSFQVSYFIKIKHHYFISIGAIGQLETPEGYYSRLGKMWGLTAGFHYLKYREV
jgi:hypothetical protein